MNAKSRIDMSLDEIIKLNRKTIKTEKKDVLASESRFPTSGQSSAARKNQKSTASQGRGRGGKTTTARRGGKRATFKIPNKLQKSSAQSARVTGAKGQAQQRRKLSTTNNRNNIAQNRRRNAVNKARQTIYDNVRSQQKKRKDNLVNSYRGINTTVSKPASTTVSSSGGRRKLLRPGFGVMQADIVTQQVEQKKQLLEMKYSTQPVAINQTKQAPKRRWQRRNKNASLPERLPLVTNEPGHVLTVRVNNDVPSTPNVTRPVHNPPQRVHVVANRMLRNTLQQPMRERRQMRRRGRGRGSGRSGQVRLLTNTIQKLQQQVASLQSASNSRGRQTRGRRRGATRQNSARGRYNRKQNTGNDTTRTVLW